ncbi:MAG: EpsG family protein [Duncaniella sp.]|uniref:EpsG family protein n=1 Tax=Duncaniella sp. TaxID=2518496 RepID=UPI0023C5A558|nr:EpsG family protein [Duncaniella sp.]MDE6091223.1 EpsG family protein [Duncaniella sp.]
MGETQSVFNWDFNLHIPRVNGTALSEFWFNFILINIIFFLLYNWRGAKQIHYSSWWLVVFFCLVAFWDTDYFSFARIFYEEIEEFRDPIYKYISSVCFGSYIIFRFIIWGGALYLVYRTSVRLKLNRNKFIYIFAVFFLLTFSYARVSLAMALYYYGLSLLIISDRRSKLSRIMYVGIIFIIAFWAHRSILLPILLTPLIYIHLTRRKILLTLIILPVFFIGIKYILGNIIEGVLLIGESAFTESAVGYASSQITMEFNWKWEIITTLRYYSFYLSMLIILWKCYFKKITIEIPKHIQQLITITTAIMIIAVAILIIANNNLLGLWVIGYRYLYMTGIPICLILSYLNQRKLISNKQLNWILLLPFLYSELFILGKIITMQFL